MSSFRYIKQLLRIGFITTIEFRTNLYSIFIGPIIKLSILILIWLAIYSKGYNTIAGFTFEDILSYYTLIIVINNLSINKFHDYFSSIIASGYISKFIIRNLTPHIYYLGYSYGAKLVRIIIWIILGSIFINSFGTKLGFVNIIISIPLIISSIAINFLIYSILGLFAIKTRRIEGIVSLYDCITSILSGTLIPLTLYPQFIQDISYLMPFQYIQYFPIMVMLGKISIQNIIIGLCISIFWILILLLILIYQYKRFTKSHIEEGG